MAVNVLKYHTRTKYESTEDNAKICYFWPLVVLVQQNFYVQKNNTFAKHPVDSPHVWTFYVKAIMQAINNPNLRVFRKLLYTTNTCQFTAYQNLFN